MPRPRPPQPPPPLLASRTIRWYFCQRRCAAGVVRELPPSALAIRRPTARAYAAAASAASILRGRV
eukprot:351518-Chlamydomonas_euryale.AAC.2